MRNFSYEMIQKAKQVKNADELFALAQENNVEMTKEEAQEYYEQFNPPAGEISDSELDAVSGGGCGSSPADQASFSNGDRAKLRDSITWNEYGRKCSSRSGTYREGGGMWWVECDTPNCGCTVIRLSTSVIPAGYLDEI